MSISEVKNVLSCHTASYLLSWERAHRGYSSCYLDPPWKNNVCNMFKVCKYIICNLYFVIPLKCKRKYIQMSQSPHVLQHMMDCLADGKTILKRFQILEVTSDSLLLISPHTYNIVKGIYTSTSYLKWYLLALLPPLYRNTSKSGKHWILTRITFNPTFVNLGTSANNCFYVLPFFFGCTLEVKGQWVSYTFSQRRVLHNAILDLTEAVFSSCKVLLLLLKWNILGQLVRMNEWVHSILMVIHLMVLDTKYLRKLYSMLNVVTDFKQKIV